MEQEQIVKVKPKKQPYESLFPQGDQLKQLQLWLSEVTGILIENQQFSKRPLYKATEDYWTGDDFHQRTYKLENTLILFKDKKSKHILGGFTTKKWQSDKKISDNKFVQDPACFLFNLSKGVKCRCNPVFQDQNQEEEHQYEGGGITQNFVHGFYFMEETYQYMWQLRDEVYILNDPEMMNQGFDNKTTFSRTMLDEEVYKEEFKTIWKNKTEDPENGTDFVTIKVEEIEVYQVLSKK